MAFDFPSSPTTGQQFSPVAGVNYSYNGYGWVLAGAGLSLIPNYLGGLTLSNDATSPNTVLDIATGGAMSDDNTTMMSLVAAITKNCNAAWAVGSGNGALDTGSFAASVWYHVFLIERTDTGVVDVLISLSASSPTMPTNYTKKRRIGSFATDASVHIIAFYQHGDKFLWVTPTGNYSNVGVGTTFAPLTLSVPTGIIVTGYFQAGLFGTAANTYVVLRDAPQNAASVLGGEAQCYVYAAGGGNAGDFWLLTNTSGQIFVSSPGGLAGGFYLNTKGWIDNRGK